MKKALFLLLILLLNFGCNRPRVIPDGKLVEITREIFLSNAYRDSRFSTVTLTDTIDLYTPIFEKYGYRPSDFSYTISNFSKRKSVRFSDILEAVTRQLTREDSLLRVRIAVLDTIDKRIDRRYQTLVLADSTPRHLHAITDTEHPDLTIPIQQGRYVVDFIYYIDTASLNRSLRYGHYKVTPNGLKQEFYYQGLVPDQRQHERIEVQVPDSQHNQLCINFATSIAMKVKEIKMTVDSLRIYYYPPLAVARDSLIREIYGIPFQDSLTRSFIQSYRTPYVLNPQETLRPSHPDTTGTASQRDSLLRH